MYFPVVDHRIVLSFPSDVVVEEASSATAECQKKVNAYVEVHFSSGQALRICQMTNHGEGDNFDTKPKVEMVSEGDALVIRVVVKSGGRENLIRQHQLPDVFKATYKIGTYVLICCSV